MPFNGTGTFNRIYSWVTDAANGIFVSSSRTDTDTNDIAAGLSNCITKDGQTTVTANIPMAGFKITGLGLGASSTDAARVDNANVLNMCEFRLTLTTGVPVTTSDVNAAGTVYWTPYKGNRVALYDGTSWHMRTSTELSIAVPAVATKLYDVFVYDNAGVPTLELSNAWTNDTTRSTALTLQDGVLVKTGALTRRYVGTFYTGNVSQTWDSVAFRYLWNYYNRVRRPMRVLEATNSWNYTTATLRQANGSGTNQLDFVVGVNEDLVSAEVLAFYSNSTAGVGAFVAIGLDSTSALATGCLSPSGSNGGVNFFSLATSSLKTFPGVGHHTIVWLEYSAATGTTTWYGDNNAPTLSQSGIHGEVWA